MSKAKAERKSLFRDLLDRRLPQILGIYLGACWAVVQFVDFLVNRYVLSPNLTDVAIVVLISFIPTIMLLAYFHGKPGRDRWTRMEKIGIPFNLVLTGSLVFFIFSGQELGAASKTVTVLDEQGNQIERVIPKSQFRKKMVLFYFDNETGDSELDWLQYGFSFMIGYDLSQDMFLDIRNVHDSGFTPGDYYIYKKIKEAGFAKATGVPLALKRKVTNELHLPYFTSGTFKKVDDSYSVEISLYQTKNSKLLKKHKFTGPDIFALADEISVQLKTDLELPNMHVQETNDLPVAEILTHSVTAFKSKMDGLVTLLIDKDWRKAQASFELAIKEDPTFAVAYMELIAIYILSNQNEKRIAIFQPLMQHLYKLPERMQYMVKAGYYDSKQQPEKQLAVVKMLVNLYPDYLHGRYLLAVLYSIRNQRDEQLAEYKKIWELDPERYETLRTIGTLYQTKGEFDEALKYFNQYASQFPEDPKSFTSIGGLYKEMADYEQANANYEKALLLDPRSISVQLTLANIDSELGNFEQAFAQYQEALAASASPKDKLDVYNALEKYYAKQGQIKKSIEYMHLKMTEMGKFSPPLLVLFRRISTLDSYVMAGQEDVAFQTVEKLESELQPPFNMFASFGYMSIYLELEDADKTEEALKGVESAIETLKWEIYRPVVFFAQGRIHEFRGEYEEAISDFQKQLELSPTKVSAYRFIGRCYRKLKDYDEAEEYLQRSLKIHPFGPSTNYELALLYSDMGEAEKALEHLQATLDVWKNADPEYKPAKLAREKLAELQS